MSTYFDEFGLILNKIEITSRIGIKYPQFSPFQYDAGIEYVKESIVVASNTQHRLFFVGNGGSAAIASHLAVDFQKRAGIPSVACNDGAMLTCLSNDYGYDHSFDEQLKHHLRCNDILFCISSSGNSQNILNAAQVGLEKQAEVITLSGFDEKNKLRQLGHINIYVPSSEYGYVELAHFAVLHSIVDALVKIKENK